MRQEIHRVRFLPFSDKLAQLFPPYDEFNDWVKSSNEFNSKGYRSDEFKVDHGEKEHILFSGCSVTYGDGLFLDEVWSHRVWKKFLNTSGYFNLAMQGNNITNLVFEIIKYCSIYGNPNKIIVNLPDILRSFKPSEDDEKRFIFYSISNISNKDDRNESIRLKMYAFQAYKILEIFCKSNNIELYSFSWSARTEDTLKDFDTFFVKDENKMAEIVYDYEELMTEDKEFAILARDGGGHPGIAIQYGYGEFIHSKVMN